jgi:hypothetical protein
MTEKSPPSTFDVFGELFEGAGRELHYLATKWPLPHSAPRTGLGLVSELAAYPGWLAVAACGPGSLVLWKLQRPVSGNELGELFGLLHLLMCPLGVGCVINAVVLRVLAYGQFRRAVSRL